MTSFPSLAFKIGFLRSVGLYDIMFRNAGVGLLFYTGPVDENGWIPEATSRTWRDYLVVDRYYPDFDAAIDAEYERLKTRATLSDE